MESSFNQTIRYLKQILRLSLPITVSFIAVGMMNLVDTIIVGNYQTNQLAYIGLATSIFVVLFAIPMGLLQGIVIKSSQKYGAKKFASCGKIYNEGRRYLVGLSIVFTIIGLNGKPILTALGQSEDMVEHAAKILSVFAVSIPFILIYANANFFLQSIRRPQVAMIGIIVANVINLLINPILVYGKFGFPEMGAVGSATSTLIVRIFLALYMLNYIYRMKKNPKLNKRFGLDRSYETWWNDSKNTRKIGYGVAIVVMATNGSFSLVSTFAGWMGEQIMATYIIMINVNTFMFMMFFALAQATSIVTASAYGKKDFPGILSTVKASYMLYFAIMIILQSLVYFFPDQIFGVFTNDPHLMITIKSLILYFMIDLFIDTLALNINFALNGRGDVKIPTINQVISFMIMRVGCCYLLAFHFDMGLKGLVIGLAGGGLSSIILNGSRFVWLTLKDKKKSLPN